MLKTDLIASYGGDAQYIQQLSDEAINYCIVRYIAKNQQLLTAKFGDKLFRPPAPPPLAIATIATLPIESIQPIQPIPAASAILGQIGEQEVEQALRTKFTIISTAAVARSGDMHITRSDRHILVEVKNYTSPIPKKEVDKFERDIAANVGLHGAIFISLRSPIYNLADYCIFATYDARPVVFLVSDNPAVILTISLVLDAIIAEQQQRLRNTRAIAEHNFAAIEQHISAISQTLGELSMSRQLIAEMNDTFGRSCAKIATSILLAEQSITHKLNLLLDLVDTAASSRPQPINQDLATTLATTIHQQFADAHILQHDYLLKHICQAGLANQPNLLLATSKKSIILTHAHHSWWHLELIAMKTKTMIEITPNTSQPLPRWCEYKNGCIIAALDKQFICQHLEQLSAIIQTSLNG